MDRPFLFDPLEDRCPSGAIEEGQTVTFRLRVRTDVYLSALTLVVVSDRTEDQTTVPAVWSAGEGYHAFTAEYTFPEHGLYWYYFIGYQDRHSFYICSDDALNAFATGVLQKHWQMTVQKNNVDPVAWLNGRTMYHVFIDRFARSGPPREKPGAVMHGDWYEMPYYKPVGGVVKNNDFFGGNLSGILDKLDYIASFGVDVLYLSPIFQAASNHRYDTADYSKIDELAGTEEDFVRLAKECARRGIAIVLDGVFNHTGADSVYFDKYARYGGNGAYCRADSPYRDWYQFTAYPNGYKSWWGFDTLPAVNQDSPGYREYIAGENGIAARWLRLGASGWRLDVVDELGDSFLDALCARVKAERRDAVMIGEVWEDASNKTAYGVRRRYFEGGQLDSVMNYPVKDGIIGFIKTGESAGFINVVRHLQDHYPKRVLDNLMNVLGTHDTARILTVLGLASFPLSKDERAEVRLAPDAYARAVLLLKLASLLQFTVPGVPCIFYGDEAGMEGCEDPFNRRCFPWGRENAELQEWYRTLGRLRKNPVFKRGAMRFLAHSENAVLYERGDGEVVVGVNRGAEVLALPLAHRYTDFLTGATVASAEVYPDSFVVLVRE